MLLDEIDIIYEYLVEKVVWEKKFELKNYFLLYLYYFFGFIMISISFFIIIENNYFSIY